MSEAPTPSEAGVPQLEEFLQLRKAIRAQRVGGGGGDACRALTVAMDAAVQALAEPLGPGVSVVAIGGYGRSELSLFSDIDIMVLHEVGDPSESAGAVFRPMWDAGLRLGHSVRTVDEAANAARARFDTFTTLLTGRLIAGEEGIFQRLRSEVALVTRARPLRRYLVAEEQERRRRSPYLEMAADIKTGRGGLRTLQGFEWERRREELIGRFSGDLGPEVDAAHESLLAIRNGLHAAAGRAYDRFSFDLREQVARWLGADLLTVGERLVEAMRAVDGLASRRWPELAEDAEGRRTLRIRDRFRAKESVLPGDRAPSAEELATILRSGQRGRLALDRLRGDGHLAGILPELDAVRWLPQLEPFHEHPVDDHLWRTVDEMQALVEGDDAHYSEVASAVETPDVLTFAAFLHDIGKGSGSDHSQAGADIAAGFCRRIGGSPRMATLIEGAVRHHLLLAEAATRRDLDDPAVIADIAGTIGDLEQLHVVYLLTVADSKATGPNMWSRWKATLLRTVYLRCAAQLGEVTDRAAVEPAIEPGGVGLRAEAKAHLDGMPAEYVRGTSVDDLHWHLELIEGLMGASSLGVQSGGAAETAVVVGRGRSGFRRVVADCFAANGIDVMEARMSTRADGVVVDAFRARDDRTGGPVSDDRWQQVGIDIEQGLSGELDVGSKVAARAEAYSGVISNSVVPRARLSRDEASGDDVVTIKCSDRIGRLAEILSVLAGCGLEIRLAQLDSRGDEVVDTFHIRGDALPRDEAALKELETRIESELAP